MKNKLLKGIAFGIITVAFLGCNPKKEETAPTVDKEQIKTEIQALETAFVNAYNNRNVDSVSYYADDAVSFLQGGEPLVGKAAILESLKKDAEAAPKGNKFTFTTQDVFPSSDGNQVVEVGRYELADSTETVLNSGNYISVFEKRDGKYVCIRDMGASNNTKTEK